MQCSYCGGGREPTMRDCPHCGAPATMRPTDGTYMTFDPVTLGYVRKPAPTFESAMRQMKANLTAQLAQFSTDMKPMTTGYAERRAW